MKIFISWSGIKSKAAALALRSWLPDVVQQLEPWMSAEDIGAGSRWSRDVENQLQESNFGIICLTSTNANAPWINFEAGAIAKSVNNSSVCPFLIDIKPSQIPRGPLNLFQAKVANKEGTWHLVQSINNAMPVGSLTEQQLERTFERWWPDLEQAINRLPDDNLGDEEVTNISQEQVLSEILDTVRSLSRKMQRDDMEREIIKAAKKVPITSSDYINNNLHNHIFSYNTDIEQLMREKFESMSFNELETLYKKFHKVKDCNESRSISEDEKK